MTTSNETSANPLAALLDQVEEDHRHGRLKERYTSPFGTHTVTYEPAKSGDVESGYLEVGFVLPGRDTYGLVEGKYGQFDAIRRFLS